MSAISRRPNGPLDQATALLREALAWVPEKPWDDSTLLHKRISEFLGDPVKYPDYIKQLEANNDD
jgi:hypothetical protein